MFEIPGVTKEDGTPISGSCNWYFRDEKLGQGQSKATEGLILRPDIADEVEEELRLVMEAARASEIGGIADDE